MSAGSLAVPTFSRLALAGPYAYLGIPGINRLISVDVSDPAAPRELQRFAMPATTLPFREVAASGAFVYVAHGTTGLLAIRAENPRALELIDTSANDLPGAAFDGVALLGNHVIAHTPAANGRAQIFRAGDDGRMKRFLVVEPPRHVSHPRHARRDAEEDGNGRPVTRLFGGHDEGPRTSECQRYRHDGGAYAVVPGNHEDGRVIERVRRAAMQQRFERLPQQRRDRDARHRRCVSDDAAARRGS